MIQPDRIREARKRADLSQEILGLRVMHNATHAVSLWESGKAKVAPGHVVRLCEVLGVTLAMLEGIEEIPSATKEPYSLELLRKTRKRLGLSILQVAKEIPVSPSKLGEWERGDRKIPAHRLERLCEVLGLTPDMLQEPAPERSASLEAEREASRQRLADLAYASKLGKRSPYTSMPGLASS